MARRLPLESSLTAAGLIAWLLVGLPTHLLAHASPRFPAWVALWLAAGAAWTVASRRARLDAAASAALGVAAAAVVGMAALLCNGYEGLLLAVFAAALGRLASAPVGGAWVAGQTIALAVAVAGHWSPRSALLLTPPYLGLQLFALRALRVEARLRESAVLAERLRIARDLHDALGHHLTALSLNLEAAAHRTTGAAQESVRVAQSLARLLLADVRDLARSIHAGEPTDLVDELRRLAADVPSPRVHLDVPPDFRVDDARWALALLRCAQELVTNAARHGGAGNVWIALRRLGDGVELSARDDGRGGASEPSRDDASRGRGLAGLRARFEELGGSLVVERASGGERPDGATEFAVRATLRGPGGAA